MFVASIKQSLFTERVAMNNAFIEKSERSPLPRSRVNLQSRIWKNVCVLLFTTFRMRSYFLHRPNASDILATLTNKKEISDLSRRDKLGNQFSEFLYINAETIYSLLLNIQAFAPSSKG